MDSPVIAPPCTPESHAAARLDDRAWALMLSGGHQGHIELRACSLCGSTLARLDVGKVRRALLAIACDLAAISSDVLDAADGHPGGMWQVAGLRNASMHIGSTIRRLSMTPAEAQADYESSVAEQAKEERPC